MKKMHKKLSYYQLACQASYLVREVKRPKKNNMLEIIEPQNYYFG